MVPSISSDFCSDVINQLWDKNSNCGDSVLAEFNNYRSYGSRFNPLSLDINSNREQMKGNDTAMIQHNTSPLDPAKVEKDGDMS